MRKILSLFSISALFSFLLIFPNHALEASKNGLLLWFDTLMPTLLPFLILSQLILKTSLVSIIQNILGPFLKKIFHCSENGSFCLLCGFLCGYPVGARLIALELKEQQLSLEEGQYLLSFCNNVSPMFCISYGILQAIGTDHLLPYLLIIYGCPLFLGFLSRPRKQDLSISTNEQAQLSVDLSNKKQTSPTENIFQLIDVCIIDSFLIMIKLCGYLIIFSIFSKGLLLLLPQNLYIISILTSLLEMTGGLSLISRLPLGTPRSLLAIATLTFGGVCCIMQTNSVILDTKLSLKTYVIQKILTMLFSLFFYFLWLYFHILINGRC